MYRTIALLVCSNLFMTIAWYGHLRFRQTHLLTAILVSWLIALPEYAFQVPANRLGYLSGGLKAYQLKLLQEAITLTMFMAFAWIVLGESPTWRQGVAFALILLAVFVGTSR